MTEKFVITGGSRLTGHVAVSGAKNAAVAILPAAILAEDECVIENLPMIADVRILLKILRLLGAEVELLGPDSVRIDTSKVTRSDVPFTLAKKLRASYYFVGAMLARFHEANVVFPGGCSIGKRPIDQHVKGFELLGIKVNQDYGYITASAEKIVGRDIYLDKVSVGATINVMLAAVKAEGTTVITNCAKEPHVVDVANFLNCMGARVRGAGTDVIKIRGVAKLHGCNYSIIPDQIETGTLMIAAAATKGDVTIERVIPTHMEALTAKLLEMGVCVEEGDDTLRVTMDKRPRPANIKTLPYPGFPTDLQQPATVLLCLASGTSTIEENLFEDRFKHVAEIRRMGANVTTSEHFAVVQGVAKLTGAPVTASDLRGGAALIVAGLAAEGRTEIYNIQYIDRGYDHIEKKLVTLGARISREQEETIDDIDLSDLEL